MNAVLPNHLMSAREVAAFLGVHRVTLYQWVKAAAFPAPIRLAGPKGRLRWKPSVVDGWIKQRERLGGR